MTGGKVALVLVEQISGILLCLILLWNLVAVPVGVGVGVGVGAINAPVCLGNCSAVPDCHQACIDKGFPKGGVCLGFSFSDLACCCTS
ncbi:hypothetical protein V6N13_036783 [Hibiscus sabdariffa]|uniref:Uncharacterized protein n=2 Tax=Hibiscus sabdariffa TaxID=183260 RepID=A0ABR2S5D3_9ROSI